MLLWRLCSGHQKGSSHPGLIGRIVNLMMQGILSWRTVSSEKLTVSGGIGNVTTSGTSIVKVNVVKSFQINSRQVEMN